MNLMALVLTGLSGFAHADLHTISCTGTVNNPSRDTVTVEGQFRDFNRGDRIVYQPVGNVTVSGTDGGQETFSGRRTSGTNRWFARVDYSFRNGVFYWTASDPNGASLKIEVPDAAGTYDIPVQKMTVYFPDYNGKPEYFHDFPRSGRCSRY